MRNYTGLAVWGCLLGLLALEFIDLDSSSSKDRTAASGNIQPAPAVVPAAILAGDGKAQAAKGAVDKRRREGFHEPFAHILEKRNGSISYRQ